MPRKAAPWWRSLKGGTAGGWYVTLNGKQASLGITDPNDLAGAFAAFQRLLSASQTSGSRPEPLGTLTTAFLDSRSHRIEPKTRRDYEILLRHFSARFGNCAAADVDPVAVEKRAADMGWSDSHRANYLAIVQAFVRWTGRKDFTLHRPAKESRGGDALISPELYGRVLRETTGDFHQLCRVLWLTGARPMEVCGLTADGIDWPNGTAILKRHKNRRKGKKRVVYLPAEALAVLRDQAEKYPAGPLFRGQRGESFTRRALVDRFRRLSKKVGGKVRSYDFRHTFITRSLMAGIPSAVVASLVGTSVAMVDRFYGHVGQNAAPLREAAERAAG